MMRRNVNRNETMYQVYVVGCDSIYDGMSGVSK